MSSSKSIGRSFCGWLDKRGCKKRMRRMSPKQVLAAVAKAVEQREHDPKRAKFRTWLNRVAQNAILNALTRGKPDRGSGDSALLAVLNQQESPTGPDSDLLRLEYRREVFRWAARQVRKEFHQATWDAFWLTAVEAAHGRGRGEGTREKSRSDLRRAQPCHSANPGESDRVRAGNLGRRVSEFSRPVCISCRATTQ